MQVLSQYKTLPRQQWATSERALRDEMVEVGRLVAPLIALLLAKPGHHFPTRSVERVRPRVQFGPRIRQTGATHTPRPFYERAPVICTLPSTPTPAPTFICRHPLPLTYVHVQTPCTRLSLTSVTHCPNPPKYCPRLGRPTDPPVQLSSAIVRGHP